MSDLKATLGTKRAAFVEEYLIDLNAAQAAVRAGYSPKHGARLMADEAVAAALKVAMEERSKRVSLTADAVLAELASLARSNVQHFQIDDFGQLALADGAPEDAFKAVASVKRKVRRIRVKGSDEDITEYECEYRLWDKNTSIGMAMKHLGIAGTDKHEHTGKDGKPLVPTAVNIRLVRPRR